MNNQTQARVTRRLMPFLMIIYILAQIDRVNVGFAGLEMTKELGFSNQVFGFGAGIFFLGYCLLQIPGAMIAEMWSARKWLSGVMIVWGFVAASTGLVQTAFQFSAVRFLLGVAEGGFFTALIVYLTHWFTARQRGKAIALLMIGIPVSNIIGAPISGLLLQLHWMGVSGWRWLLILEGIPAVLGGIITLFYLPDRPSDASWISPEERQSLTSELEREAQAKKSAVAGGSLTGVLKSPMVLLVTLSYFMVTNTIYGLALWLPKLVQRLFAAGSLEVSLIVAIPYIVAAPAMFLSGWHSDKTGERARHAATFAVLAGAGLALSQVFDNSPLLALAALSMAAIGILGYYPPMWALPTQVLSARTAAASYGFINLSGNLGGFVGPYAVGWFTDRTGSYAAGVYALVVAAFIGAAIIACVRPEREARTIAAVGVETPSAT